MDPGLSFCTRHRPAADFPVGVHRDDAREKTVCFQTHLIYFISAQ